MVLKEHDDDGNWRGTAHEENDRQETVSDGDKLPLVAIAWKYSKVFHYPDSLPGFQHFVELIYLYGFNNSISEKR